MPKTTLPPFEVKHILTTLSQSQGWGITQLNVPGTWVFTRGRGKTALVIDTGYCDHVDLEGGMLKSKCKSFISYETPIIDKNGHSSHCCGIIGARDNDIGMVGVAPACNIVTAKALAGDGSGSMQALEQALEYAIQLKPDVVSMSLGAPRGTTRIHNLIKKLYEMNIPVICAAGNSGRRNDVNYPAAYPETIAVTAFDRHGNPARFNSTGNQVDFSAPGVDIHSTWINQQYVSISGTSMATPFITGLVLLLLAKHEIQEAKTGKNDCKTVEQIREHLVKYADDKGVVGKDDTWGYGVINPVDLISACADEEDTQPVEVDEPEEEPIKPILPRRSCWDKFRDWLKRLFR